MDNARHGVHVIGGCGCFGSFETLTVLVGLTYHDEDRHLGKGSLFTTCVVDFLCHSMALPFHLTAQTLPLTVLLTEYN